MPKRLTFADVLKNAPPIHVFRLDPFEKIETTILEPKKHDQQHSRRSYIGKYTEGRGTKKNPYTYPAAPISPHYAIIDLWFKFRQSKYPPYTEVNDWLLRVDPEGVTAEDGVFTRLLPA